MIRQGCWICVVQHCSTALKRYRTPEQALLISLVNCQAVWNIMLWGTEEHFPCLFLWGLVGPTRKICEVPESGQEQLEKLWIRCPGVPVAAVTIVMLEGSRQHINDTFANPVQQKHARTHPCPFYFYKGKKGGLWSPFNVLLIFLGCCRSQKVDYK